MKAIKTLLAFVFAFVAFNTASAQSDKSERTPGLDTQSFKVYGECGMCKKRIEKAAITVDGLTSAVWNEDSKQLAVQYKTTQKDALDNLKKKMASIGHDTEAYAATDKAYQNLPGCCHYKRKQTKQ